MKNKHAVALGKIKSEKKAGASRKNGALGGRPRVQGSCRFDTYYKLEWRDETLGVWRPVQKSFATIELAKGAQKAGKTWRVIERSEKGTRVL